MLQVFQVTRFLQVLMENSKRYYSTMTNFDYMNGVVGVYSVFGTGTKLTTKTAYYRLEMTTDFVYTLQVVLMAQIIVVALYSLIKILEHIQKSN